MATADKDKGVLVIYTGGTIGSRPRDKADPDSPQVVTSWDDLKKSTPELRELQDRGFGRIDCKEFDEALDSCNVGPSEWADMARTIQAKYDEYNGFVILHGTDTMVYTAAALSFMLRYLDKPVVLTGAQRSAMVDVRNDATQNIITSLLLANPPYSGLPHISEVIICFGGLILRGNRGAKRDTSGYQAYETPNLAPLGEVGNRITINERLLRPRPTQRFYPMTRLDSNVAPIFIYPGIQNTDLVRRQLEAPNLRAAIVHTFGSGDIPTKEEFIKVFAEAHARGTVLAAVTQCRKGPVELGIYDTSALLMETGFVAANDITVEAAQCKLMTLLGDPDITREEVEASYQVNLAGEQSTSLYVTPFPRERISLSGPASRGDQPGQVRIPGVRLEGSWNPEYISRVLLRLRGGRVLGAESKPAQFCIYANANPEDRLTSEHPGFVGEFRKYSTVGGTPLLVFDVTRRAAPILTGRGDRISFTLTLETPGASCSWDAVELAVEIRERES